MWGALEVKARIATRERGGGGTGARAENRRAERDSESDSERLLDVPK